jgi:hypothetical protein
VLFVFKKEYKALIRSGRKTQTVRVWKPRKGSGKSGYATYLKAGKIIKSPGLGRLRIDEIVELKLSDLTQEDARLDGFKSREEMLAAIRKIYKLKQSDDSMCYRIRFKYLGEAESTPKTEGKNQKQPKYPNSRNTASKRRQAMQKNRSKAAPGGKRTKDRPGNVPKPRRSKQENLFPPF